MPGPQKENGYTPIANEILEAVAKLSINATQFRILMVVWRFTYGFNRKHHKLSEGFISQATSLHKKQIGRELSDLIKRNILIEIEKPSFSKPRVIAFNKYYVGWVSTKTLTGSGKVDQAGIGLVDPPGIGLVDQERKYLKTILKKEDASKFTPESEPLKAALYLRSLIEQNNPRQPLPPADPESEKLQSWAKSLDQLHRLGPPGGSKGYTWQEIKRLIDFSQADDFWAGNILSAAKLREQVVKLENQLKRKPSKPEPIEHRRL
jgi:phage replication O-like protein O